MDLPCICQFGGSTFCLKITNVMPVYIKKEGEGEPGDFTVMQDLGTDTEGKKI